MTAATAPPPPPARLSKTRFLSGLQCLKRLWFELHEPDTDAPFDPLARFRMDQGTRVGELARERWPGGRLVADGHLEHAAAEATTATLLGDPTVPAIHEAAFTHDGVPDPRTPSPFSGFAAALEEVHDTSNFMRESVERWLSSRPGAESGDAAGRATVWPRRRSSD